MILYTHVVLFWLAQGEIIHFIASTGIIWHVLVLADSLLHVRARSNPKLTLAINPEDAEALQPPSPAQDHTCFTLIHNSAITNWMCLRICISEKHSDWSVPGDIVHLRDAIKLTIPCSALWWDVKPRLTFTQVLLGCMLKKLQFRVWNRFMVGI